MIQDGFEDYLQKVESGRLLFEQGEIGDSFYVIKDGLVGILRTENNIENQIATVGPGEVLGELALLEPDQEHARSASAKTMTTVSCWKFDRQQFNQLMANNDKFRNKILSHLGARLRETSGELARANRMENQLYDASLILLKLLTDEQLYTDETHQLQLSPSLKNLANFLNATPDRLKTLLSAPQSEKLEQLSDDQQEVARELSRDILEKGLNAIQLKTSFENELSANEFEQEITTMEGACRAAKQLNELLKEGTDQLTREKYETIWDRFEQIKDRLNEARQNPSSDDTLTRRLKAFIKGIRKQLQSINRQTLEP